MENVMRFLLPVQTLGGVDVSRYLVDDEDSARPFPAQDVSDGAVAFVWIRMQLKWETQTDVWLLIGISTFI